MPPRRFSAPTALLPQNGRNSRTGRVAKGTLYLYFENKQDLFVSLLEDRIWEYVATLTKSWRMSVLFTAFLRH